MKMTSMIAVLDFIPEKCPVCGIKYSIDKDSLSKYDFFNGAAHRCECGFRFQYCEKNKILAIAEDLRNSEESSIIDPIRFAAIIQQTIATSLDSKERHQKLDDLLCKVLISFGYEIGVNLYNSVPKFYS